jgi:hypothetical protein
MASWGGGAAKEDEAGHLVGGDVAVLAAPNEPRGVVPEGEAPAVVLVPLNGGACGACNTAIPMSRRASIKAGGVIDACENCGVILYFAD